MRFFFFGLIALFVNLPAIECDAQTSKLPPAMPERVEMRWSESGGMLPAYTNITVTSRTLTVEEKKPEVNTPSKWSAKIAREDAENLYRLFVENKFDTIKNDKQEGIVYDAGSEGVNINAGVGLNFNVSYGPNSPLSGANQKRYLAVSTAFGELRGRYENKPHFIYMKDYAVLDYDPRSEDRIFKNARPATLSEPEITRVRDFVERAVSDHNSRSVNEFKRIGDLENYKFQLIPATDENGEKWVWVNAFCDDFKKDWKKQLVLVDDGGNCFFQFYINLKRNSFERFTVNGEG
ncbi:MAG: hypothetical protein JSS81_01450 [Acidobacteria bacterium]|nr:hypothetical protein [Acidobacteriota bacterium]